MKTISLKLPPGLEAHLHRVARQRRQSKSAVVRAALEQYLALGEASAKPLSALDLAGDLVGSVEGPTDLSTNPAHMQGYGH